MSQSSSGLQYDELGFLIGLKKTGRDVAKIDQNVEQIISLLEQALKARESQQYQHEPSQPKLSALAQALIDAQREPVNSEDLIREQRQATTAVNQLLETVEDLVSEAERSSNSKVKPKRSVIQNDSVTIDSQESIARELGSDRQRDANGRFIGSGKESGSTLGKITQTLSTAITNGLNSTPQGIDPTVDAINEVATVLSPVKRVAGFMLRPLSGLMKSRKRSEPLPKEESEHNKKQIKMLQRIADNLASRGGLLGGIGKLLGAGGGLLGGLLGGLFGKGGKGLTKLLKLGKGLPVIGALLTALSFSDWKSQNTKEKGGTVGSLAGGTIGAIAGSLLGPVGTLIGGMAGAWVGDKLGSTVAPYFKEWTDSLKAADLPGILKAGWDSFIDLATKAFNLTPAGKSASLIKDGYDWIKQKLSGNSSGTSLLFRKQYGGQGLDAPAQFGGANQYTNTLEGKNVAEKTKSLLRLHEGFKTNAYWDVNAYRIGYGSDSITDKNGNVRKVTKDSKVTREDAERDLVRRSKIFAEGARAKIGPEKWDKLPMDAKTALTSVAYNYGSLPKKVVKAAQSGDLNQLSTTVRNLENHNDGINKSRRNHEADLIKNSVNNTSDIKTNESAVELGKGAKPAHTAIAATAERMLQNVQPSKSSLNLREAEMNAPARSHSLSSSFTLPKVNTHIEPAKEYLTSPSPQQVVVVNQNGGNINQNVSDRLFAHAITGGLGMGANQWDG
ncbi:hypothetical protein D3C78_185180 [compost metagenome]